MVAIILGMLVWGALPHYDLWSTARLADDEQLVVAAIRTRLADRGEGSVPGEVVRDFCYDRLDTCRNGQTAAECPFFGVLLDEPIRTTGWRKDGGYYVGPAGGQYLFDRQTCEFRRAAEPQSTRPTR